MTRLVAIGMFLAPFSTIHVPGLALTASDIVFVVALCYGVAAGSAMRVRLGDAKLAVLTWIVGAVLVVLGLLVSDLLGETPPDRTIAAVSQYMFAYVVLMWLAFALPTRKHVTRSVWAFILGLATAVTIGGLMYVFVPDWYVRFVDAGIFVMKLRLAPFMGPNGLAKTIALVVPFLLSLLATDSITRPRTTIVLSVFVAGLVGAASFGGTLATLWGIGLYSVLAPRGARRMLVRRGLLGLTFMAIGIGVFGHQLEVLARPFERILHAFEAGQLGSAGSASAKVQLMQDAAYLIAMSPLVGYGSLQSGILTSTGEPVHNTYLLAWVEGGLLSFVGILLVVLAPLIYGLRIFFKQQGQTDRLRAAVLLSTASVFALNLMTNTNSYARYSVAPVVLMTALVSRWKDDSS